MAQETHAATGAPDGAHKAPFPPFQASSFAGQLLWFAIAFGLLYYVMAKVALPKVGAILDNRRQRIGRDLDEAQALRTRSEEAGAAYEQSLADAHDRSKGIAREMRDRLAAESDGRRKTLEAELAAKLAAAEATIKTRTGEAMSNVRAVAGEAAAAIVERLIGRTPDGATLDASLDRTLRS